MSSPYATGGTVTTIDVGGTTHYIHTFTADGTFEITHPEGLECQYLIVAAGGSGGGRMMGGGGGGGAGGILTGSPSLSQGSYSAVVGQAPIPGGNAVNGGDSQFMGFTAIGGGRGGEIFAGANSGGSGGGGAKFTTNPGSGTSGQGYAGGYGPQSGQGNSGGGGGGASEIGLHAAWASTGGGYGGDGLVSSITGTATYYGGGGGAAGASGETQGAGGAGGGGTGGTESTRAIAPTPGVDGTGGGGGGADGYGTAADTKGGHGIVIVRYAEPEAVIIETDVFIEPPPALLAIQSLFQYAASNRPISPARLNLRGNRLHGRVQIHYPTEGVASSYALFGGAVIDVLRAEGIGYSDFSAALAPHGFGYVLDIESAAAPPLRLPIRAWQATLRRTGASRVQAVVPAAARYLAPVTARFASAGRLTIRRQVRRLSGAPFESPLASAPMQAPYYNQTEARTTLTLIGYEPQDFPGSLIERTLEGVRDRSQTGTTRRVRCSIDWLLRPNMVAHVGDWSLLVDWISYQVSVDGHFMDISGTVLE